jgi:hypothetical protein
MTIRNTSTCTLRAHSLLWTAGVPPSSPLEAGGLAPAPRTAHSPLGAGALSSVLPPYFPPIPRHAPHPPIPGPTPGPGRSRPTAIIAAPSHPTSPPGPARLTRPARAASRAKSSPVRAAPCASPRRTGARDPRAPPRARACKREGFSSRGSSPQPSRTPPSLLPPESRGLAPAPRAAHSQLSAGAPGDSRSLSTAASPAAGVSRWAARAVRRRPHYSAPPVYARFPARRSAARAPTAPPLRA